MLRYHSVSSSQNEFPPPSNNQNLQQSYHKQDFNSLDGRSTSGGYSAHRENLERERTMKEKYKTQEKVVNQTHKNDSEIADVIEEKETINLQLIGKGIHDLNKGNGNTNFSRSRTSQPYDQDVMPGQPQGQQMIRGHPQGQQMVPGQPPGQQMMTGQPPGQHMMYGHPQGQQMMPGQPPGQQMMHGQPQGQHVMFGQPAMQAGYNIQRPLQQAECWMACPSVNGCPPGLEYLTQIDQLLVKQRIDYFEVMTGYETNNKYDVKNVFGQTIYKAKEDTDCCNRYFCGPNRPFIIHITDNLNNEVIQIRREYRFHCGGHCLSCFECCQDKIQVESPPGEIVGYVKQEYDGCNIRYIIMDEKEDIVLRIHGPSFFYCYCPGDDYPLDLMSVNGDVVVGKISKQWSNLYQEFFTDADNFGIQFPMDLDVRVKAVVLGAVFLIDFMFFERKRRRHR